MKPSSFQPTIENQFDYICKLAMEDERKDYFKQLSRLAKHEVSFSEIGYYLVSQFATADSYSRLSYRHNDTPVQSQSER